jgi:hypothetical protein
MPRGHTQSEGPSHIRNPWEMSPTDTYCEKVLSFA